jgi:hypothetical protein
VPMGHCDAATHDRGAAVRRRVGARSPTEIEVPHGGAIRGPTKVEEMCEARRPASEAGCTCARSSTGGWAGWQRLFTRTRTEGWPRLCPLAGRRGDAPLPSPLTQRRGRQGGCWGRRAVFWGSPRATVDRDRQCAWTDGRK